MADPKDYYWYGGAGGDFSDGQKWKLTEQNDDAPAGQPPGSADWAYFNQDGVGGSSATITGSGSVYAIVSEVSLTLSGGSVTATWGVDAVDLTLQNETMSGGGITADTMTSSQLTAGDAGATTMTSSTVTTSQFSAGDGFDMDGNSIVTGVKDQRDRIPFYATTATISGVVKGFSDILVYNSLTLEHLGRLTGGNLTLEGIGGGNLIAGNVSLADIGSTAAVEGLFQNWVEATVSGRMTVSYLMNKGALDIESGGSVHVTDQNNLYNASSDSLTMVNGTFTVDKGFQSFGKMKVGATGTVNADSLYIAGQLIAKGATSDVQVKHLLDLGGGGEDVAVTISKGASLVAGSLDLYRQPVGYPIDGKGDLDVEGAGSMLQVTGAMNIGAHSLATFELSDGAKASSGTAAIGGETGGDGEVRMDGSKSSWTVKDTLLVGGGAAAGGREGGRGVIDVGSRTELVSGATALGLDKGSTGIVNVHDASWQVKGDLYVGNEGDGTLELVAGGKVDLGDNKLRVGIEAGSSGTISLTGDKTTSTSSRSSSSEKRDPATSTCMTARS